MFTNKEIKRTELMQERFINFQEFLNNDFFKRDRNKYSMNGKEYEFISVKNMFSGVVMLDKIPVLYVNFLERKFQRIFLSNDVVNSGHHVIENLREETLYKRKCPLASVIKSIRLKEEEIKNLVNDNAKSFSEDLSFYNTMCSEASKLFFSALHEYFEEEFLKNCAVSNVHIKGEKLDVAMFNLNLETLKEKDCNASEIVFKYLFKRVLNVLF